MVITTTTNDIKERLSIGYVTLVAARAGCQVLMIPVDRESCDIEIRPVAGAQVRIDIQLKATAHLVDEGDYVSFPLEIKNYNDLRSTEVGNLQLLIVVDLHDDENEWVLADIDSLIFKRCAFWHNLAGAPETNNVATKTVRIPKQQIFNPEGLRAIIQERYNELTQAGA